MSDSAEIKMVSALCTQCGGALTVDPSKETADCPFCGSSFIVEKAINQYQVQHATFEHVDNVNIDMSGTVNSVLDFVGKQMSEGREFKTGITEGREGTCSGKPEAVFYDFSEDRTSPAHHIIYYCYGYECLFWRRQPGKRSCCRDGR